MSEFETTLPEDGEEAAMAIERERIGGCVGGGAANRKVGERRKPKLGL